MVAPTAAPVSVADRSPEGGAVAARAGAEHDQLGVHVGPARTGRAGHERLGGLPGDLGGCGHGRSLQEEAAHVFDDAA